MLTSTSIDEDQEDVGDGDHNDNTAPFGMDVDEDGTRHYTSADGKNNLFFKKNTPQNGKLLYIDSVAIYLSIIRNRVTILLSRHANYNK
jgi:hypothetical protein